jgi:type I restriction enzyme M protein
LWFLDKGKSNLPAVRPELVEGSQVRRATEHSRADTILFIDARHIYRQIDRAHRDWADAQISFIANIVRLYRGEAPDYTLGGEEAKAKLAEFFTSPPLTKGAATGGGICYRDIPGLCKAANLGEIETQGWSLNPGRYVGVAAGEEVSDEDFKEKLEALNEELEVLNSEALELQTRIAQNVASLLS